MKIFLVVFAVICMFAFVSCSHSGKSQTADVFTLSDTLMKYIKIDTARNTPVKGELRLTGKIVPNEAKVIDVFPLVGGNVEEVSVELGDYVEAGKVLAVIKSGEIADLEQQLNAAQSNLSIAEKNLAVTEDMYKSKLSSEKDYLTSQREYQKADGELKKIQQMFSIYSVGTHSEYIIKAPIAGFVVEKNVNRGLQIRSDRSEKLFTISSLEEVWVVANVYESDIEKIKVGYEATVTTLSYPDRLFTGKVDRIYNVLDPVTKVMKVRIKLKNPGYLLKPEMFANVTIHYLEGKQMLAIPSQSVIFDKNKNFVMVYKSRSDIETREINIYKDVDGSTYLNSGLHEGDTIISRYHLLVYDALND